MSTDYQTRKRFARAKCHKTVFDRYRERRARRMAEQSGQCAIPAVGTIFDPENLIHCFDRLQSNCGPSPGPDGITYNDLGRREMCRLMRELSEEVLSGRYQPSRARLVRVRKANGRGYRVLSLRSITYRIVAAALADALGKYYDAMFLPGSHGYRPKRGMQTMLLAMESLVIEQQRYVIAQDDIRNAFGNVSVNHVMGILRQHVDDAMLLEITETILRGNPHEERTTGIDQGSPLSPLMLCTTRWTFRSVKTQNLHPGCGMPII